MPEVSVILRSCNNAGILPRTLLALAAQRDERPELICVDSGSTDGTHEILRAFRVRCVCVAPSEYVPGAVLNLGARQSAGRLLVFLNSDCVPHGHDFLARLLAPLRSGRADAVYGRQIARPDARGAVRRDYLAAFPAAGSDRPHGRHPDPSWRQFFSMAVSATRRDVWEREPLDPTLTYSEDIEWATRLRGAGLSVVYVTEACATHSHDYSLPETWQRAAGEGAADELMSKGRGHAAHLFRDVILPWSRSVAADAAFGLRVRDAGMIVASPARRIAWHLGRWWGSRAARSRRAGRAVWTPAFQRYDDVQDESARRALAWDTTLVQLGEALEEALPPHHGCRAILAGSHGRRDGALALRDGRPVPLNNLDLLVVAPGPGSARRLRSQAPAIGRTLTARFGFPIDLSVLCGRWPWRPPPSLMLRDAGLGCRVLVGPPRVPLPWPVPTLAQLRPRESLQLLLNRATLLLVNRHLAASGHATAANRHLRFRHALKAIIGMGDVVLIHEDLYQHSETDRRRTFAGGAFTGLRGGRAFSELYEEAAALRCEPPARPGEDLVEHLERRATALGNRMLLAAERKRLQRPELSWKRYVGYVLSERPLLSGLGVLRSCKGAASGRTRILHRLLAALPLLLFEEDTATARDLLGTGGAVLPEFLRRWGTVVDGTVLSLLDAGPLPDGHRGERPVAAAARA